MKNVSWILLIGLSVWIGSGCELMDIVNDEPGEYSFTSQASPAEGGTVEPESGTYEEGALLRVVARPNEGWRFVNWDGNEQSDLNPLCMLVEEDITLTANFEPAGSMYTVPLSVTDDTATLDLAFGQHTDPSTLDEEAPPAPPGNALHAYFLREGEQLLGDFRNYELTEADWRMNFQADDADDLTLSWTIDADQMSGTLSIYGDGDDLLVDDMSSQNSISFPAASFDYLEIRYRMTSSAAKQHVVDKQVFSCE